MKVFKITIAVDEHSIGEHVEGFEIVQENKKTLRIASDLPEDEFGFLLQKDKLGVIATEDVNRLEYRVSFYVWTTEEYYEVNRKKLRKHFSDMMDVYDRRVVKIRKAFSNMIFGDTHAEDL